MKQGDAMRDPRRFDPARPRHGAWRLPRRSALVLVAAVLAGVLAGVLTGAGMIPTARAGDGDGFRSDPAPAVTPKLLMAALVGGKGDQALDEVEIEVDEEHFDIVARGGKAKAMVRFSAFDDSVEKTRVKGESSRYTVRDDDRHSKSGRLRGANVSYGFRQVHSLLQQPFVNIGSTKLYGWNHAQAKGAKAKYAPFMSDSRVKWVEEIPDGTYFIFGWSDGGNSSFQAMPTDINVSAPKGFSSYIKGSVSWCIRVDKKGKLTHPVMSLRGGALKTPVWDPWGRVFLFGRGVRSWRSKNQFGVSPDGGGFLMIDSDWKRRLLGASFGKEVMAMALDAESGIVAIVGVAETGKNDEGVPLFQETNPLQDKPGKDLEGYLVVLRLWEPLGGRPVPPAPEGEEAPEGAAVADAGKAAAPNPASPSAETGPTVPPPSAAGGPDGMTPTPPATTEPEPEPDEVAERAAEVEMPAPAPKKEEVLEQEGGFLDL